MGSEEKSSEFSPQVLVEARKTNPHGVSLIEYAIKKGNFYRNLPLVAGYLKNCPDTDTLRVIMEKVKPIFDDYVGLRQTKWVRGGNISKAENPVNIPLFAFLVKIANNVEASKIVNRDSMDIGENEVSAALGIGDTKKTSELLGYSVTANMLIKVVKGLEEHMEKTYQYDPAKNVLIPDFEDLHRAFSLFRCWSRINEDSRKSTGTEKKKPNNKAKQVHYLQDFSEEYQNAVHGQHFDTLKEDLLLFEPVSAANSEDSDEDVDGAIPLIESNLVAGKDELIDFKAAQKSLRPMSDVELASLRKYAVDNLNVKFDEWEGIGTDGDAEMVEKSMSDIIQKVYYAAKRAQSIRDAELAEGSTSDVIREISDADNVDYGNDDYLDHASMPCHDLETAAKYLGIDKESRTILEGRLQLLRHQVTGDSTMLHLEREAWAESLSGSPVLKAAILADDAGLGKTIEVLALVYFAHRLGLQRTGERVAPPGPTIVCIPPGVTSSWYLDYERYFSNALKMYFVGSAFRGSYDPIFQGRVIKRAAFEQALRNPASSNLYQSPEDPGRTIFVISHSTINKYTVEKSTVKEDDSILSMDNIGSSKDVTIRSDLKRVRQTPTKASSRDKDKRLDETSVQEGEEIRQRKDIQSQTVLEITEQLQRSQEPEVEDETLLAHATNFDTYILRFMCKYPDKIYRLVLDEGHAVRHPESGISRATKLLKSQFLWIVSATPLLNKTRDFYGYSHLFYDTEWSLNLSRDFCELATIAKFSGASTPDEKLSLFNPVHIRRLAVHGHIPAVEAAVAIPTLLRRCMIRRTQNDEVDGFRIGDDIPKRHINSVVLTFNRYEQYDYCTQHEIWTTDPLSKPPSRDDKPPKEGRTDAERVKKLLCASITPKFFWFHQRVAPSRTRSHKLKKMANKPFAGIDTWLKYTHPASDYQYAVPTTRVDRARELLNMSPVLRFICRILYDYVIAKGHRLLLFAQTPSVAWLLLIFCLNYGVDTAWLRAGLSHSERDKIVQDFNNPDGTLRVLITTHQVGGFGLNLQLSGCHHVVVVELPRNLNTLIQSLARLSRIGQESEVYVWLLMVDHTFHRYWSANLARKAVSDLGAQLGGKLADNLLADEETIDLHAEEALNLILGWKESRTKWDNVRQLNLKESLLSEKEKRRFVKIGGAPGSVTKTVEQNFVHENIPGEKRGGPSSKSDRAAKKSKTTKKDGESMEAPGSLLRHDVHGQHASSSIPPSAEIVSESANKDTSLNHPVPEDDVHGQHGIETVLGDDVHGQHSNEGNKSADSLSQENESTSLPAGPKKKKPKKKDNSIRPRPQGSRKSGRLSNST